MKHPNIKIGRLRVSKVPKISEIISSNDSAIIISPLRKPKQIGNIYYKGKDQKHETFDFGFNMKNDDLGII